MTKHLHGLYMLDAASFSLVYGPEERALIEQFVEPLFAGPITKENFAAHRGLLEQAEVIFSGWGAPTFDKAFLDGAPRLKAIFYGAGATGSILTDEVWKRGIVISSAYAANAIPVAEYCLSMILFSLKQGWHLSQMTRKARTFPRREAVPGAFGSKVGLVSLGITGRTLRKLLRNFDLEVMAHDPFVSAAEAEMLEVEVGTLKEVFAQCDVVSIHTPLLPETQGLITGEYIASMKRGATFINTSRGQIVKEEELIEVAAARPDLQFVLDVTSPEPPVADSRLYDLPNVILTPHIAGSQSAECRRMGRAMVEELKRFVAGEPLEWGISPELAARTSHRPKNHAPLAV